MPHLHNEQLQHQTPPPPPDKARQTSHTYPGKDWKADVTVMPRASGNFRDFLVLVDMLSGWVEAFSTRPETAAKVAK